MWLVTLLMPIETATSPETHRVDQGAGGDRHAFRRAARGGHRARSAPRDTPAVRANTQAPSRAAPETREQVQPGRQMVVAVPSDAGRAVAVPAEHERVAPRRGAVDPGEQPTHVAQPIRAP